MKETWNPNHIWGNRLMGFAKNKSKSFAINFCIKDALKTIPAGYIYEIREYPGFQENEIDMAWYYDSKLPTEIIGVLDIPIDKSEYHLWGRLRT